MNDIPDIPDNLTTEEKLVWAMRFAGNREQFAPTTSSITYATLVFHRNGSL